MVDQSALGVASLGPCAYASPLRLSTLPDQLHPNFVDDGTRVLLDTVFTGSLDPAQLRHLEKAGPRERIFFDPRTLRCAVVTCGGLSPGLNNVLRSLVLELWHRYGVRHIRGLRFGYDGLTPGTMHEALSLDPDVVSSIHHSGGSVLGLGRGAPPVETMVDTLEALGVQALFALGGDGTLRGAHAIAREARRRGLTLAVVGVPKTIDNDVPFCDRTFGFETAVQVARAALDAAHAEALSFRNGVGLVKLMGRDAGFISARATLASGEVDFCLVPEVPFELHGPRGLLAQVEQKVTQQGHALVVIAEGCGVHLAAEGSERDASGNLRYGSGALDVGTHLREALLAHFARQNRPLTLKYIDPSYLIRSLPANASDSMFCDQLARNAVHAALSGRTDVLIGNRHRCFVHVPLSAVTSMQKRIDPDDDLWLSVLELTGQPRLQNALRSLPPPP